MSDTFKYYEVRGTIKDFPLGIVHKNIENKTKDELMGVVIKNIGKYATIDSATLMEDRELEIPVSSEVQALFLYNDHNIFEPQNIGGSPALVLRGSMIEGADVAFVYSDLKIVESHMAALLKVWMYLKEGKKDA